MRSSTPNHCWKVVKTAQLQVEIARTTAVERYGIYADSHMIWHCMKPWLSGRDLRQIRHDVLNVLIPECRRRVEWEFLVKELEYFLGISTIDHSGYTATCTLCIQEGP